MTEENVGERVYFDTNIFCEPFEGTSDRSAKLKEIFRLGERKPKRIVTSELTLAELAASTDWPWRSRFYLALVVSNAFIDLRPVSRGVLLGTGDYRRVLRQSNRNVKLPDAIHAVTAVQAGCQHVLTGDKRFVVPHYLQIIDSDEHGLDAVSKVLDA